MRAQSYSGPPDALPDDRLGTVAVSLAVTELQWAPDMAPAVMDRISRDAVAYPEQFDRRSVPLPEPAAPPPSERSARRAISRLAVITVILAVIVAIVVIAATATGAEASAVADHILTLAAEAA